MMIALQQAARSSGDPFTSSAYFAAAEASMVRQWNYYIWPRISSFSLECVLDLASGHGRNAEFLSRVAGQVICADINNECIEVWYLLNPD
jgi:ubiquinone/menaquinone biosynthesis C-methylase UbiE